LHQQETTLQPTRTYTTEELRFKILCESISQILQGILRDPFFYLNKNKI
jgi:hypothetical protein